MPTQGERLRNYLDKEGIKYVSAARRMGVHVNTLRGWFKLEMLNQKAINKMMSAFPPIHLEYPEVEDMELHLKIFKRANPELFGPEEMPMIKREDIYERYHDLLHRYNTLLEKYVALQEKIIEEEQGKGQVK